MQVEIWITYLTMKAEKRVNYLAYVSYLIPA